MENLIETQKNIEELFGRHELMPTLRSTFSPLTDDPMKLDVVCQIYLHKQANVPTMVGLFSPKWGTPQEVSSLLVECVEEDLLDFDMETNKFVFNYELTKYTEEMLERYQFPLPMIVPPKRLTKNNGGSGYITEKSSVVLNGSKVFNDEDLSLDHLNRANSVKLSLNLDVLTSDQGEFIKPNRKPGEEWSEYSKRVKQAKKFHTISVEVMEGLLVLGNEFYLTHKYDRRGRTYAVGYHVSSQGDDYRKACLELARKEVCT